MIDEDKPAEAVYEELEYLTWDMETGFQNMLSVNKVCNLPIEKATKILSFLISNRKMLQKEFEIHKNDDSFYEKYYRDLYHKCVDE